MIRAFVAIVPPEEVLDEIDAVQDDLRGANWVPSENLHLTLSFVGEQPRPTLEDLDAALTKVSATSFTLSLAGVAHFGGRDPRLAYVGVRDCPPLKRLQSKVETAARSAGIDIEDRRYTPHVTVARWGRREVSPDHLRAWVEENSLFEAAPFDVDAFELIRSELSRHGPIYSTMARYPLTT